MDSVTGIISFDFTDSIPYRFTWCLRIQLGDITLQDAFLLCQTNSARLPSNGSRLNLLRALLRSLTGSLNHGLLKHFCTADVLGIVSSAVFFKMDVNEDIESSASLMADRCRWVPNVPSLTSIFEGGPQFSKNIWKVVTITRVRTNVPGEIKK